MKKLVTFTATATMAFALSACEVRREGTAEAETDAAPDIEAEAAGAQATPTPTASASPVASIIRDETAPEAEPARLPTRPVEMTLPFPDGSNITASVERQLVGLLREDALDEDWPVILGGHTDSGGNDAANLRASRSRAEAVAAWLVERGVDNDRIEVIGFGEQNPVAPNARADGTPNEEGRRLNRRVEIRIAPAQSDATGEQDDDDA